MNSYKKFEKNLYKTLVYNNVHSMSKTWVKMSKFLEFLAQFWKKYINTIEYYA